MARFPGMVWFGGQPVECVESLAEHLLRSLRSLDLVPVRLEASASASNIRIHGADLARYRKAGAADAFAVSFGGDVETALETLLRKEVACRIAHGLLLLAPGVSPVGGDLEVFVTRPLRPGQRLLERRRVEVARMDLSQFVRLNGLACEPPDIGDDDEEHVEEYEASPERVAAITGLDVKDAAALLDAAERGVPLHAERWTLPPGLERIGRAQVVVIDARGAEEREAGAALRRELVRLRQDRAVAIDLGLPMGGHHRTSIFVTDLSDACDAELKKVLARIKRCLSGRATREDLWW